MGKIRQWNHNVRGLWAFCVNPEWFVTHPSGEFIPLLVHSLWNFALGGVRIPVLPHKPLKVGTVVTWPLYP